MIQISRHTVRERNYWCLLKVVLCIQQILSDAEYLAGLDRFICRIWRPFVISGGTV